MGKELTHEEEMKCLQIINHLDKMSTPDVVKIGHHLNKWEWLDILPGKPDGWDEMDFEEKHKWASAICAFIDMRVGEKALLRYFHTTELGKTDDEFEDWWESNPYVHESPYRRRMEMSSENRNKNSRDSGDKCYRKTCYCCIAIELIVLLMLIVLGCLKLSGFSF